MKIKKILFLSQLIIMFYGFNMQAQETDLSSEVRKLKNRAETAYKMKEYEDALEEYKKIVKLVPNYPDIYKAMGDVYENLGTEDDMNNAIKNYQKYIDLAPKAIDKDEITDKISSLEYIRDKQSKTNRILDDLSGMWISNVKMPRKIFSEGNAFSPSYIEDSIPVMAFKVTEIGNEGKFRIEIQPISGFYQESFIQKVVNIVPDKKHNLHFMFADSKIYNPSAAKYAFMKTVWGIAASKAGVSPEIADIGAFGIDVSQERDIPKETKTMYDFQLRYDKGKLKGYCNIVQNYKDSKTTEKTTQDDLLEITLEKNDRYYDYLMDKGPRSKLKIKDQYGYFMSEKEVKNSLDPNIITMRSAKKMENFGMYTCFTGLSFFVLGGVYYGIGYEGGDYRDFKTAGEYLGVSGLLISSLGTTIWISEHQKYKKARLRYNEELENDTKTSATKIEIGITPSGKFGLTYNF